MTLSGLKIDPQRLIRVIGREVERRSESAKGRGRRVSLFAVESTRVQYPKCRCEDYGLREGITLDALTHLAEGCTGSAQRGQGLNGSGGWVCNRLVAIRRLYGM